jgi:arylsulfatase A-like enzyme
MSFPPSLLLAAALAGSVLGPAARAAAAPTRPNLLVLQTDEHNFRTLGAYRALLPREQAFVWGDGVAVETPNLDWIAAHGAIADRFYATSPVCTPSRAALMTGRYPQNTGAIRNDLPLRDDQVTFAEVLRRAGYATGYAGKWHLDGDARPGFAPARKFGWEDNRHMFNRGHWKNLAADERGPRVGALDAAGRPTYDLAGADEKSFATDFLADRTIDFIRRHRERPFCWMVSFPDPHGPNTVRAPYDTMYLGLDFRPPASARSAGRDLPAYAATLAGAFNRVQMARYFGMVKCLDDNIGRILATLRESGLIERTFIVFTSDHGDLCGEHGRDNKGVPMEASARIPFLLHAPGVVPPGTIVRAALGTVDFKPTILALMGVANPTADEGRDASALFRTGTAPAGWADETFVRIGTGASPTADAGGGEAGSEEGNRWLGVFSRRYKFVVAPGAAPSLFDLEADPDELANLVGSAAHRGIVRRQAAALLAYAQRRADPLLAAPRVERDLAWALSDRPDYPGPLAASAGSPFPRPGAAKKR